VRRGLLVRIGIDKTSGGWNAPVNPDNKRFIFVPIKDDPYNPSGRYIRGGKRTYDEVLRDLAKFARECGQSDHSCFRLPQHLRACPMHLDPDFLDLTYGERPQRARKLTQFGEDDFIAFYAGLRPLRGRDLIYGLIGLFVLAGPPLEVSAVPASDRLRNAHTRWLNVEKGDIVVRAKPEQSGLFERCIPIGDWYDKAYRVRKELLEEWGDLYVRKGWIQRSANPPEFKCPDKFRKWLEKQHVRLDRAQYQVPRTVATGTEA